MPLRDIEVVVGDRNLVIDIQDFDLILGLDSFAFYHTLVDCFENG